MNRFGAYLKRLFLEPMGRFETVVMVVVLLVLTVIFDRFVSEVLALIGVIIAARGIFSQSDSLKVGLRVVSLVWMLSFIGKRQVNYLWRGRNDMGRLPA